MNYVVLEMADHYNGYVYSIDDSAGVPVKVLDNKEDAIKEKNRLQIQKFANGLSIGSYGYEIDEVTNLSKKEVIKKLPFCNFNEDSEFYEWIIPKNLSKSQLKRVVEVFDNLEFYTIAEVK